MVIVFVIFNTLSTTKAVLGETQLNIRECVMSVIGTTGHSSCNCIDTWQ